MMKSEFRIRRFDEEKNSEFNTNHQNHNHHNTPHASSARRRKVLVFGALCIASVFYVAYCVNHDNTIFVNNFFGPEVINTSFLSVIRKDYELAEVLSTTRESITDQDPFFPEQTSISYPSCHLPKLNPFDYSISEYVFQPPPANCENKEYPLLFRTDIHKSLIQVQNPNKFGFHECCYNSFHRLQGGDGRILYSDDCIPIKETNTVMESPIEFIQIKCLQNETWVVVDMFGFVFPKKEVEARVRAFEHHKSNSKLEQSKGRQVNVVILGIDAVSHMNFIRTMPLSHGYVTKNLSGHSLSGFTKVGDNTFPNIVPVTMGQSVDEIEKGCWSNHGFFDNCPFIWKNFTSQGYTTAYGEDATWMGIWNYEKSGFRNPPTDYYFNPLTYQQDRIIGHNNEMNANICTGPRLGFQVLLNFTRQMAMAMNKTRRYFQFIWATSLFHDFLNHGKLGDEPLLDTLKWLKNEGYLEDTVLILMSDHGIRWGDIRDTLQGKLEERMPFLYFVFPSWFSEKYQSAVSNLIRNEQKLTNPYDIHETLKDLLVLDNIEDDVIRRRHAKLTQSSSSSSLPRGISLFLPISESRSCEDAGIEAHFCVCFSMSPVNLLDDNNNNTLVEEAARSIVHHINGMFVKFPQCIPLTLGTILDAQFLVSNSSNLDASDQITDAMDPRLKTRQVTFRLAFSVGPSGANFEATTTRHTDGSWKVSGQISRTNLYKGQSDCVSDYDLKKFCYCAR